MGATNTTFEHALNILYPKGIHQEMLGDSPLLTLLTKTEDFTGKQRNLDVVYAGNRSRSADAAKAFAAGSQTEGINFALTRAKNYAGFRVSRETMLASENDRGALIRALDLEISSAKQTFKEDLESDLYSTGTGKRGRIAAGGISGSTITLDNADDSRHFDVGDVVELSTANGGGAVKAGSLTVASLDRDAGTLTFTQPVTTGVASALALDFIFKAGDYDAKMKGVDAWVPATAPGATLFFGVARNKDATRLGGLRFDGSGLNHEEAIIKGLKYGFKHGASPRDIFVSPDDFGALELILGSKKEYEDVEVGGFGFTTLSVNGPKGKCRIYMDPWCPSGAARALKLEHWALYSLKEFCHIVANDGLRMMRVNDADDFSGRLAGYYQLGCEAPGQNIRIGLPSLS